MSDAMRFSGLGLMGGSGSSGTTLLAHLLSRSTDVGSGPEFNCFNHTELYDIQAFRECWPQIKAGRTPPSGYIDVPVFMTHRDHYQVDDPLIEQWMREVTSAAEFADRVQIHLRRTLKCPIVLLKSPTNVYCFRLAHQTLPGVRLIHVIRDGRDVAVSLMRRGFNLFGAGSRWLYDTLRGLEARGLEGLIEVRYETLVRNPDTVLADCLHHLSSRWTDGEARQDGGRDFGLYAEDWKSRAEPRVWNQTPSDPISDRSVGQYRQALGQQDLSRLCRIRLRGKIVSAAGLPRTFGDLLDYLGYGPAAPSRPSLSGSMRQAALEIVDYWRRCRRFEARRYWHLPKRYTSFS